MSDSKAVEGKSYRALSVQADLSEMSAAQAIADLAARHGNQPIYTIYVRGEVLYWAHTLALRLMSPVLLPHINVGVGAGIVGEEWYIDDGYGAVGSEGA